MAKYFMGGTRLENLERLMMDPSRSEHSPPTTSPRQKGRYLKAGQLDNDQPPEQDGGVDKCAT